MHATAVECVQMHKGFYDTHKGQVKGRYYFPADGLYLIKDGKKVYKLKVKAGSSIKAPEWVVRQNCLDYNVMAPKPHAKR